MITRRLAVLVAGAMVVLGACSSTPAGSGGAGGSGVAATDCSELAKAEGAVTCCSLIFEAIPAIPT